MNICAKLDISNVALVGFASARILCTFFGGVSGAHRSRFVFSIVITSECVMGLVEISTYKQERRAIFDKNLRSH